MARRAKYPGITKTSDGYDLRITGVDPRTGRLREKARKMKGATQDEAVIKAQELYNEIKTGGRPAVKQQTLGDFARSWLARKAPRLRSELTRARYIEALEKHVLPAIGDLYVATITKIDLETWMAKKAASEYAPDKRYSHATINGWWRVLKELLQSAVADLDLPRDPTMKVLPLPAELRTERNSLTPEELARFLAAARTHWPQWYALILLGFLIGARPANCVPPLGH